MKIFYAVQATGNGHVSRASQLFPYLKKYGEVDIFLSGTNTNLDFDFPIKYQSKGWSLHYSQCGGLNYWDIFKSTQPIRIIREANSLPLEKYDVIINDFDSVTSLACKLKGLPSVQLGHQASFQSDLVPRPEKKSVLGEIVLKHYSNSPQHIGFHFQPYDSFIFSPVIKSCIQHGDVKNLNHVTVYLPAFQKHCLHNTFRKLYDIQFHWFLNDVKEPYTENNITYYPVNQNMFNTSLLHCHGLITGGGFETPSEALFLGKRLMSIPINNHYEQQCNAAALKKMGIKVLDKIDDNFAAEVVHWYYNANTKSVVKANNINETLQCLFDTYPYNANQITEDVAMFV